MGSVKNLFLKAAGGWLNTRMAWLRIASFLSEGPRVLNVLLPPLLSYGLLCGTVGVCQGSPLYGDILANLCPNLPPTPPGRV